MKRGSFYLKWVIAPINFQQRKRCLLADYSSCTNTECTVRGNCARFRMEWGGRQSISCFPTKKNCEYMIPIDDPSDLPFKIQSLQFSDLIAYSFDEQNK